MFRLYAGVIPSEYRLEGLGFGFYDRLNLYYSYYFPSGLEFIVVFSFLFHNTGFSGSKQMVVLRYKMF